MKTKKIKIGLAAALGGVVAMHGCNSQMDKPVAETGENTDSIRLENRLKELFQTEYNGELTWGAMCYVTIEPVYVDYVCSHCGETIKEKLNNWMVFNINQIEDVVNRIKTLGYDVVLDVTEFCPHCSKSDIENPELIFKIRFSQKANYHVARSNIINEYLCLLAFLSNQDKYSGFYDEEYALHDNIAIIQKMTGLGTDLKIEE